MNRYYFDDNDNPVWDGDEVYKDEVIPVDD